MGIFISYVVSGRVPKHIRLLLGSHSWGAHPNTYVEKRLQVSLVGFLDSAHRHIPKDHPVTEHDYG